MEYEKLKKFIEGNVDPFESDLTTEEQKELALDLIGMKMYSSAEYWGNWAKEKITEPFNPDNYPRKNSLYEEDKKFKEIFKTLNEEHKNALKLLIDEIVEGIGHSMMCTLDQPPFNAECKIGVETEDGNSFMLEPPLELHEMWFKWQENYKMYLSEKGANKRL